MDPFGLFGLSSKKLDLDSTPLYKNDDYCLPLRLSSLTSDPESYLISGKDSKAGFRIELEQLFGTNNNIGGNDIDPCLTNYLINGDILPDVHQQTENQPEIVSPWIIKPIHTIENNTNPYDSTIYNMSYASKLQDETSQ